LYCNGICVGQATADKISKTNIEIYKTRKEERLGKRKQTTIDKYNCENVMQNEAIRQKSKETMKLNTGYEYALQNPKSMEKYKNTCMDRFGVECSLQNDIIQEKARQTFFENYGVRYALQIKEMQLKIINTMMERYGVTNGCQLSKKSYSKISQELFWNVYKLLPNELINHTYFAELNKEFNIYLGGSGGKQYFYDFVISNLKICIEFNGDFWHVNPKYYNGDDKNIIHKNKYNKEIWEEDKNKINAIKKRGFEVIIVWESDYRQYKDIIINNLIKFINYKYNIKENVI